MSEEEKIDSIERYYKGEWEYISEDGSVELHLAIGANLVLIEKKDGKELKRVVYNSNPHFMSTYLTFLNQDHHAIKMATETYLDFGSMDSLMVGQFHWIYRFLRVQ